MFETTMPEHECPCAAAVFPATLDFPEKCTWLCKVTGTRKSLNKFDIHVIKVMGQQQV